MTNSIKNSAAQPFLLNAELFIATGCSHCPIVMDALNNLLKTGKLASLKISNIAVDNERATKLNIRSVPWFALSGSESSMVFAGNYSAPEINKWVAIAQTKDGMAEYIESFLAAGELMTVTQAIQLAPETFSSVIKLLENEETSMDVRIGLDALLENFSVTETLKKQSAALKKMASEKNIRLQIDALHYLALTGDAENTEFLREKTKDKDKQIQDAASEALETLNDLLD